MIPSNVRACIYRHPLPYPCNKQRTLSPSSFLEFALPAVEGGCEIPHVMSEGSEHIASIRTITEFYVEATAEKLMPFVRCSYTRRLNNIQVGTTAKNLLFLSNESSNRDQAMQHEQRSSWVKRIMQQALGLEGLAQKMQPVFLVLTLPIVIFII